MGLRQFKDSETAIDVEDNQRRQCAGCPLLGCFKNPNSTLIVVEEEAGVFEARHVPSIPFFQEGHVTLKEN